MDSSGIYAIRLLMIGVIICFVILEFHGTIPRESWATTTSFYIASAHELDKCVRYCTTEYVDDSTKMIDCIKKCVALECQERHRDDPKMKKECIDKFFAKYTKSRKLG
ncbi:hypothetical protein PIB30_042396 [Stylosanthes scabra]|uniref:Uncharacterized protein n=1 Tax=Stylosanthes scabra TaxID=79078 RepID=A0ABU6XFC9_9FABA|nr:hypothetical protein [Stylosanthes scabra]